MASKAKEFVGMNIKEMKRVKSDDFKECYANYVELGGSHLDVRLSFFHIIPGTQDEAYIREQVGITMSAAQAKALAKLIQRNLEGIESEESEA